RRELLARATSMTGEDAWEERESGMPKLLVTSRALRVIKDHPEVFAEGSYEPIEVTGDAREHVVAFARGGRIACIVPRLWMSGNGNFDRATIDLGAGSWNNVFTGSRVTGSVPVSEIWETFPVALLVKEPG
ncbi:MAG: malto-oligosyltrehalose synthase, partial [Actinomycetota bacterium]